MRSALGILFVSTILLGACGRDGPPVRDPGVTVPDISRPIIRDETTEPTKPTSTLF